MKTTDRSLLAELDASFPAHLQKRPILIGLSGGLDSTVLFHLFVQLYQQGRVAKLEAMHVHHGLMPMADAWAHHVQALCAQYDVPLWLEHVRIHSQGEGIEAAARKARYQALTRRLQPGGVLVTAHHRGDQAETFLLQLLRGAGVRGLAAMPRLTPFANGWHWRPLLDVPRQRLKNYATTHGLSWVDDPSNLDLRFARNLIRWHILPALARHWPKAEATLARAAKRMANTEVLLAELGCMDLAQARCPSPNQLEAAPLLRLSQLRLTNAIRTWLLELGLNLPPETRLMEISRMFQARKDANPKICWPGVELRYWQGRLYALKARPPIPDDFYRIWDGREVLECPTLGWRVFSKPCLGKGLRLSEVDQHGLVIRLRQGGERLRLSTNKTTRSVKKLLQDAAIPPWERERLPLFFLGGELAQVGDCWIAQPFSAGPNELGLSITLEPLEVQVK